MNLVRRRPKPERLRMLAVLAAFEKKAKSPCEKPRDEGIDWRTRSSLARGSANARVNLQVLAGPRFHGTLVTLLLTSFLTSRP